MFCTTRSKSSGPTRKADGQLWFPPRPLCLIPSQSSSCLRRTCLYKRRRCSESALFSRTQSAGGPLFCQTWALGVTQSRRGGGGGGFDRPKGQRRVRTPHATRAAIAGALRSGRPILRPGPRFLAAAAASPRASEKVSLFCSHFTVYVRFHHLHKGERTTCRTEQGKEP